jgi:hypothetical protein
VAEIHDFKSFGADPNQNEVVAVGSGRKERLQRVLPQSCSCAPVRDHLGCTGNGRIVDGGSVLNARGDGWMAGDMFSLARSWAGRDPDGQVVVNREVLHEACRGAPVSGVGHEKAVGVGAEDAPPGRSRQSGASRRPQ